MRNNRVKGQLTLAQNAMLEVFLFETVYVFYIGRSTIMLLYRLMWLVCMLRSRLVLSEPRSGGETGAGASTASPNNGNAGGASREESYGSTGVHTRRDRDGAHERRVQGATTGGARQGSRNGGAPEFIPFDDEDASQEEFRNFSSRHSVLILVLALCLDVLVPGVMHGWHPFVDAPPTGDFPALRSILGSHDADEWGKGVPEGMPLPREAVSDAKASEMFAKEYYYSKFFALESAIMDFMTAADAIPRIPLFILLLDVFIFFVQRICIELFFSQIHYAVLTPSPADPHTPQQAERDRKEESRSRLQAEGGDGDEAGGWDATPPPGACTVRREEVPNGAAVADGPNESLATPHDCRKRAKGQKTACKYIGIPPHEDYATRNLKRGVDPRIELAELSVNGNSGGVQCGGSGLAGAFASAGDTVVAFNIVPSAAPRDGGRGVPINEPPTQGTPNRRRGVGEGENAKHMHQSVDRARLPSPGDHSDLYASAQFGEIIADAERWRSWTRWRRLRRILLPAAFKRILPDWTVLVDHFRWLFTGWQKQFISIVFEEERRSELR
ncbi:unnamed protein product [Phytomonas sp. EM1]|nr:unnamed protein product [Phytomonas sp. EM1]|eukprot:CCW65746.1 unnamed protein product [Phytomonas sp. isolate EM1]